MPSQGISVTKKRGRPSAAPSATVRLPQSTLDAAEVWAHKQADQPSRAEAIRRLVEKALGE